MPHTIVNFPALQEQTHQIPPIINPYLFIFWNMPGSGRLERQTSSTQSPELPSSTKELYRFSQPTKVFPPRVAPKSQILAFGPWTLLTQPQSQHAPTGQNTFIKMFLKNNNTVLLAVFTQGRVFWALS